MSRLAHSRQPRLTRRLYSGPGFERRTIWPIVGECVVGLVFWSLLAWAIVAVERWVLLGAMTWGWGT